MKKILCMMALVMVIAPSCRKTGEVADVSFSSPYNQEATVPDVPGYGYGSILPANGVEVSFPQYSLPTNTQKYFDDYHVSGKNVKSATFQSGEIKVLTGTSLDFLDKIEIFISAEGLPEVLVAYQYNVPKGVRHFDLLPTGTNMREYIKHPIVYGRVNASMNTIPVQGTKFIVSAEFKVIANPVVNYDK